MESFRSCVMCRRGLHRGRYQEHILSENLPTTRPELAAFIQENAVLEVVLDGRRKVCHRCWQRAENATRHQPELPPQQQPQQNDVLHVPNYKRAPNTATHCVFRGCHNTTRHRIPEVVKVHVLLEHKLYIPESARVCHEHLHGNNWDDLPDFCNISHDFTAAHFSDVCDILRNAFKNGRRLRFDELQGMNEEEMHFWTGRTHEQFDTMLSQTPSLSQRCADPRTVLGILITKLRTGEPDERLATLFSMSRRKLERILAIARECLSNDYVVHHLGFQHLNRNDILNRNLRIPKHLFGNEENTRAIIISDGTYIYIHKSSNFLFQRLSYSLHKYQNLLKPFLLVTSDGYIIDVIGPFAATKTDAEIMSEIMNNDQHPLHTLLQPNDVFILDRGFRDSLSHIEGRGYVHHVPPTKNREDTQLTTDQANDSRLVTMCRWVVEVVNGRFKVEFKLFRQKYFNNALLHMFCDLKIAAAITNHFHIPITDSQHSEGFIERITQKMHTPNILYNYVEAKRLNHRRADFQRMEANDVEGFPRLSEEDVILLSLGTYQLKLAKSYCSEHLHNGLYTIETYREDALHDIQQYGIQENTWLLRGRIQSRHVRSKQYFCYVLINSNNNTIIQHYCTCLTGRRTVGSCAHIISIIWYLGYARHQGFTEPAIFLNNVIIDDA